MTSTGIIVDEYSLFDDTFSPVRQYQIFVGFNEGRREGRTDGWKEGQLNGRKIALNILEDNFNYSWKL